MPHDIFISHANEDASAAAQVCTLLEARGVRCWIAPRNVAAGSVWDEAILDAIEQSRAFLLILSKHANASQFVKNEVNRAFGENKPIVTLRLEDVAPGRSLQLYLARHHWTDAFPPPLGARVESLADSITALLDPASQSPTAAPAMFQRAPSDGASKTPSIAVLPFANMSGDKDNEYFSDGLAEEILNLLAKIRGLKVIARTSSFAFRGKEQDITQIAEALRVQTILEGSVRRAGNRVRVTAQLISAADGSHIWSERYDRQLDDLFALQDEIAGAIVEALGNQLAPQPASKPRYMPKMAAYEAFLKARHCQWKISPKTMAQAKEYYEQAIALDPQFALAHVGLGDYFLLSAAMGLNPAKEALPRVREQAQMAADAAPSLAEAHAMLGIVAAVYDYDWKTSERRFQQAMELDPASAQIRLWRSCFSVMNMRSMRFGEAAAEIRCLLIEDPLNVRYHFFLGTALIAAGEDSEAVVALRHALELDENFWVAYWVLGIFHAQKGRLAEALDYARRARAIAPFHPPAAGLLAGVLMRTGETNTAEELLRTLRPGDAYKAPGALAIFHLVCGEMDQTAHWVGKAIEQRDFPVLTYALQSFGKDLLSSRHWPSLAKQMNLPESMP